MASYHVFIDRPADPSAEAIAQVATAIGQRYGLPAAAIQQRMTQGRFRAKANVDLETAKAFAKDLQRLGAICSIEDEQGNRVGEPAVAASGFPAVGLGGGSPGLKGAQTPSALGAAAPPVARKPADSPLAGIKSDSHQVQTPGGYQSGLAAAFGDEASTTGTDLGALGAADSAAFSLSALDGSEDAVEEPKQDQATAQVDDPQARANLFRPPEEHEEAQDLELAVAAPVRNTPPPMPAVSLQQDAPATPTPPPMPRATPRAISAQQPAVEAPAEAKESPFVAMKRALGNQPRVRLLAGVMLAIMLGFIPATVFASWRESSAYADSRKELHKIYAEARKDISVWNGLDESIKAERGVMSSSRQTIAITSILIWGAAGGGFAFLWFRKVPWERFAE